MTEPVRSICLPVPERVAIGLDVVVGPAGLDALRMVLGVPAGLEEFVALLDEQPLIALVVLEGAGGRVVALSPAAASPDDREAAVDLLAVEDELELPVLDGAERVESGRLRLPRAPVPDDHVPGAVLLRRDDTLEVEVLDRVVLDVDSHAPDRRIEGQALGDRPAHQDAFDLQAEVVVEPGGSMALDEEPSGRAGDGRRCRLGRLPEVAFAAVFLERHGDKSDVDAPSNAHF